MLPPRKLNSSHAQFLETFKTHAKGNATCISHTKIQESLEIIINGYTAIYFRRIYHAVNLLQYRRTSLVKLQLKTPAVTIGRDMWTQIKSVAIPVFSGNKKTYESWKAAFIACIDKAPATPEYKLLQLRQYLFQGGPEDYRELGTFGIRLRSCKREIRTKVWWSKASKCH